MEAGDQTTGPTPDRSEKPSTLKRIGAVVLGIAGAIWGAAVVAVVIDLADSPTCDDPSAPIGEECFDGSSTAQTLAQVFGWPSAIAFIALLPLGIYYAATGRRGGLFVRVLAVAMVLGVLGVIGARI
jgi:hypothetical protein